MSEITAAPDALRDEPPGPIRKLRGNLGVASIVFMVVAAAAPLGVIGGVVPLGIAAGNGAGFPATFVVSTVILLFFAVGFTALTPYVEDAGAFFSYVRTSLGFPAGIGIAFVALVSYVAIEAGVYGLLGPAGGVIVELFGGPALPWWVFAAVAFAITTFLGYRNIELSSRVLAVLLTAEIAIVVVLDAGHRLPGRRPRACRPASSTRAPSSPARWVSVCCSPSSATSGSRPPRSSATRPARPNAPSRAPPMWR